ncbi:Mannosyltransferase [Ceraceosorus bombacis]|uniref:GPI mannosyltransferase 1 n=1 Tax=Ceraceosorus bombacis TaxID=401625 RepID=A0A0P1BMS5_9BASI|nr:Mannosyltransferase [Ceraceosorus bombacis]
MKLTQRRVIFLGCGIALRLGLLAWGAYQDAYGEVPYTDIDHSVFVRGARSLFDSCPLESIIAVEPQEDYEDLADPPQAIGRCAQGWLPAVARFILQAQAEFLDPEMSPFPVDTLPYRMLQLSLSLFSLPFRSLAGLGNPYQDETFRYTPLLAVLLAPTQLLPTALAEYGPRLLFVVADLLYTPLLAVLLAPTQLLPTALAEYGPRLLFVVADLLCAVLMWTVLDLSAKRRHALEKFRTTITSTPPPASKEGSTGWVPALWLLNPFPAQIATRGSAESLIGLVVLGFLSSTLYATPAPTLPLPTPQKGALPLTPISEAPSETEAEAEAEMEVVKRRHEVSKEFAEKAAEALAARTTVAAVDAGAPLELSSSSIGLAAFKGVEEPSHTLWGTPLLSPVLLAMAVHLKLYPAIYAVPTLAHLLATGKPHRWAAALRYAVVAGYTFAVTGLMCWLLWGPPYLEASFFYHLTRLDVRHNFSPTFLPAYLGTTSGILSTTQSTSVDTLLGALAGFGPQLVLVIAIGWTLGSRDLAAACAAQTLAFVAFNKVSTSQYYMWFLWFIPIVAPTLKFASPREPWILLAAWVGAQAIWLSQAYLLEFRALDTFVRTWSASLLLLVTHAIILARCLAAWGSHREQLVRDVSPMDAKKKAD